MDVCLNRVLLSVKQLLPVPDGEYPHGTVCCSFYATDPDGTEYFYCGKTRIKIKERFTSQGKEMEHFLEDVIQFAARLA